MISINLPTAQVSSKSNKFIFFIKKISFHNSFSVTFGKLFRIELEFEVKRETNAVNFYERYAQEIITSSTPGYS